MIGKKNSNQYLKQVAENISSIRNIDHAIKRILKSFIMGSYLNDDIFNKICYFLKEFDKESEVNSVIVACMWDRIVGINTIFAPRNMNRSEWLLKNKCHCNNNHPGPYSAEIDYHGTYDTDHFTYCDDLHAFSKAKAGNL